MSTLYHYCSTDSFCSIIKTKSIWLSSLKSSNDSQEGRIVSDVLIQMAKENGIGGYFLEQFQLYVKLMEQIYDGLGFCLSADGDLLSQWRGYADDATGVCIGFSTEYLERLGACEHGIPPNFTLEKIEYRAEDHRQLLEPTYRELHNLMIAGGLGKPPMHGALNALKSSEEIKTEQELIPKATKALISKLHELRPTLFLLKSDAFQEEKEHRLVTTMSTNLSLDCEYRASGKRIVPYRSVQLAPLDIDPIVEIILGPKHQTHPETIARMLETYRFSGASVRPSKATYR